MPLALGPPPGVGEASGEGEAAPTEAVAAREGGGEALPPALVGVPGALPLAPPLAAALPEGPVDTVAAGEGEAQGAALREAAPLPLVGVPLLLPPPLAVAPPPPGEAEP